jgi:peptidoglycan/LPS O-acetylase OafA/YrhL
MIENRLVYLDGLRGVLALIVFFHHFLYAFYGKIIFGGSYQEFLSSGHFSTYKLLAFTPLNVFFNPGAAIHFFFLLSGFVQSHHYFKAPSIKLIQKGFFKRYFRLAIPTAIITLLVFVFHKLHWINKEEIPYNSVTADWVKNMLPDSLSLLQVVQEGFFSCFLGRSGYYPVLWTMPIELLNSFMVFALLLFTHKIKNKAPFLVLWLFVQLFVLHGWYSSAFTIGLLLAYLHQNNSVFSFFFTNRIVKTVCLIVGFYFVSYPYVGYKNSTINSIYFPISFLETGPHIICYLIGGTILFCYLLHSNASQKLFSQKPFLFLGNISFMLYLIHLLIIFSFSPFIFQLFLHDYGFKTGLLITGALTFGLVFTSSFVLTVWIDKLVLKLCHAYTEKYFGA